MIVSPGCCPQVKAVVKPPLLGYQRRNAQETLLPKEAGVTTKKKIARRKLSLVQFVQ